MAFYPEAEKLNKYRRVLYLLICYKNTFKNIFLFFLSIHVYTMLNTYKVFYLRPLCVELVFCSGISRDIECELVIQ